MDKQKLEFLKDFIKIFDRAKFDVTGPELLNIAGRIKTYAGIVMEEEKLFVNPIPIVPAPIEKKKPIARKKKNVIIPEIK